MMNNDGHIAEVICRQLEGGHPVVLVSIVEVQGSSPRHRGAKMVVAADGEVYGTVGGSLLEARAILEAKQALGERRSRFMDFDLAGIGPDAAGMICGGKAVLLLDFIPPSQKNVAIFRLWHDSVLAGKRFTYLTRLDTTGEKAGVSSHAFLFPDGALHGDAYSLGDELAAVVSEVRGLSATSVLSMGQTRVVADPIRKVMTLYCIGAGHVAVPTVHIAALVGFRIVVIDDRAEFANAGRFPDAEQLCVIDDYSRALAGLEIDEDAYIVIMTRGHRYDRVALEQALRTRAAYIGMISSRTKRDTVFQALRASGVQQSDLDRVHSPLGVPIGSETPEEIAVSIVAELILERAKQAK